MTELRCYICADIVPRGEQKLARAIEELIIESSLSELYSDEFVHCTGPPDRFYEDGAPVVCLYDVLRLGHQVAQVKENE